MSIYVDPLMSHGWILRGKPRKSCHLFTDESVEVLHEFAERIGMKRIWFQISRSGLAHYDLTESRRKLAVKLGAIECTGKEAVKIWRNIRSRSNKGD